MLSAVSSVLGSMISWIGYFFTELTFTADINDGHGGRLQALLPFFLIGLTVSILCFSVKALWVVKAK